MGIHELGHLLFGPLGDIWRIAGGSLAQCIFPLLWIAGFLQVRWYFAAAMCFPWLGMNLLDVAVYAGDANARLLPLSTGPAGIGAGNSEEAYNQGHDWYQLLTRTGRLDQDLTIAHNLRIAALLALFTGIIVGLYIIVSIVRSNLKTSQA